MDLWVPTGERGGCTPYNEAARDVGRCRIDEESVTIEQASSPRLRDLESIGDELSRRW